jgi:hypothetical protein
MNVTIIDPQLPIEAVTLKDELVPASQNEQHSRYRGTMTAGIGTRVVITE